MYEEDNDVEENLYKEDVESMTKANNEFEIITLYFSF